MMHGQKKKSNSFIMFY